MLACEICGYQAKTPQGLAGHRQFKHQLTQKYAEARELAGKATELAQSIELLEKRKAELERSIATLGDAAARLEAEKGVLQEQVDELREAKARLEGGIAHLEQVRVPELAERFRQQLMQAGWIPPGTVEPDTIVLGELAKWVWRAVAKKAWPSQADLERAIKKATR